MSFGAKGVVLMILQDDEDSSLTLGKYVFKNTLIVVLIAISIVVICVQSSAVALSLYAASPAHASAAVSQDSVACVIDWYFPDVDKDSEIKISKETVNNCNRGMNQVQVDQEETDQEKELSLELLGLLSGYPIADMIPAMVKQDRSVAAFLVGIAKKESDWGKHVPRVSGKDCYNYWGYKGKGGRGSVAGGYACFASPEEAVTTVGGKINYYVYTKNMNTPAKMITWKCGSSCAGHDPKSVSGWIGSVDTYYRKITQKQGV